MKLFGPMYEMTLSWARHPRASYYLGGLSFAESSFFPIPPDVMLAPMSMATPSKAWHYAFITTLTSVLGGLAGYAIGYFAFEWLTPWLHEWGYWEKVLQARAWFDEWGVWVVFIAGFSPIPYKLFTITAGAAVMPLLPFIVASTIGRGARFVLVALLMARGGEKLEQSLRRYVEILGWAVVALAVAAYFWLKG